MRDALIISLVREVQDAFPDVNLADIEARFSRVLDSWHVEKTGKEVAILEPGLPQPVKDYLVSRAVEGLAEKTLKCYKRVLEMFFNEVRRPLTEIDGTTIKLWLFRVKDRGVTERTRAWYRTVIATCFKWLADNDYLLKSPARNVAPIKHEKPQHHALSRIEFLAARNACKTLRERTIFELFYSTGCRVSEIVGIRRDDIDLEHGIIHAYQTKTRKPIDVFISPECEFWLRRYLGTIGVDKVLFRNQMPDQFGASMKPMGVSGYELVLRKIGERAGLPKGRLHPHILRHTLATSIVRNGGELSDAQQVLGHKRIETTLVYAEQSTAHIREVHRRTAA